MAIRDFNSHVGAFVTDVMWHGVSLAGDHRKYAVGELTHVLWQCRGAVVLTLVDVSREVIQRRMQAAAVRGRGPSDQLWLE